MKTHSNLNINLGTIYEDGSYNSSEDEDYEDDLDDDISQLSMDEFSFDTVTTAYRSESFKAKKKAMRTAKKSGMEIVEEPVNIEKISGNTKIGLPFLLDLWRDCMSRARISVQVQMLSGEDTYKKAFVRVSTDGRELVLTLPMSPYLARSDFAFNSFLLAEQKKQLSETEMKYLVVLLKHHPKCTARMVAVAKVKGRSNMDGFFYEQRIPLPRKVQHEYASTKDGDDLFFGKKFIKYPDGSVFLHVELIAETKDNYIPEERMLDPNVVKMPPKMSSFGASTPMETETTTDSAQVLPEEKKKAVQPPKRQRVQDPAVETVTEDSDDDDDDATNATGLAAHKAAAAAAEAEADAIKFAEAARSKAASVLEQADQQKQQGTKKSSLQSAAEQGQSTKK